MKFNYFHYKCFVIVLTIFTFMFSIIIEKDTNYKYISLIPLFYVLFFMFFKRIHRYSIKNKGLFMLNIFMFIKYSFAILLICVNRSFSLPTYYGINIFYSSYINAIILIIVEMLTIFLTIELFSDKIYKKSLNLDNSFNYSKYKPGIIMVAFIGISLLLIILNWNLFINKSLIIFSNKNSLTETIESDNQLYLIFNAIKTLIMGLLINKFIIEYKNTEKKRFIIYSYFVMSIYVFLNISTSRINMILPFIFFVFLTSELFGKFAKRMNILFFIIILLLFSTVSIYKNPWKYDSSNKFYQTLTEFSTGIQEYTSNVLPTAIGLQAIDYYGHSINIGTLFNDIFGSVPFLSHYINQNNRIYRLYNEYALRENTMSQLIPMSVSSIAYFSIAFCWLLIFINVVLLMHFDTVMKEQKHNFLEEYISLYLLFIFASSLYSNVQMLSGRFFVIYLPVALILFLDKKFRYNSKNV